MRLTTYVLQQARLQYLRYISAGAATLLMVAVVCLMVGGPAESTGAQPQRLHAVVPRTVSLVPQSLEEGEGEGEGEVATEEKSVDLHVNYGELSPMEKEYLADPVKFANEHPDDALRIHLKRKAMRENALREEYHKKREETLERLSETNRARNVVIAILATIVVITVLIDLTAGYVVKHTNDFSRPVVEILFKELSVLGCIALCVFMSVKTGIPEQVSEEVRSSCARLCL